jgi:hypothetical protein
MRKKAQTQRLILNQEHDRLNIYLERKILLLLSQEYLMDIKGKENNIHDGDTDMIGRVAFSDIS